MENSSSSTGPTASYEVKKLAQQAAAAFLAAFGDHPGFRLAHAKGIVCHGFFEPTKAAAELSNAVHFRGGPISIVARFSNSTGLPGIPDGDPMSNPKGFSIRFKLPSGSVTDIVANGLNGFVAGTSADFVAFITAVISTRPDSPKPTPVEKFVASHPATAAYLAQPNLTPASFATSNYFGNNAFIFVSARGKRLATRYQIVPVNGTEYLDPAVAAAKSPNFLMDEIRQRIAKSPVEFRLMVQIGNPTDPTSDATRIWPDDRKKVDLGIIRLKTIDTNSAETEKKLMMDPVHLTGGIELSDDPLPVFRSLVYSISIARRHAGAAKS